MKRINALKREEAEDAERGTETLVQEAGGPLNRVSSRPRLWEQALPPRPYRE